ncbi:hypothetical protein [Streptomyces sp. NPDC059224]|uniref:hypothetical protein n=1 Tax=Streptomyces sp. NPDC059224 TaxID=3346775 RepID=UPI0036B530E0
MTTALTRRADQGRPGQLPATHHHTHGVRQFPYPGREGQQPGWPDTCQRRPKPWSFDLVCW